MSNSMGRTRGSLIVALGAALVLLLGGIGAPSGWWATTAHAQRERPVVIVATDGAVALLDDQRQPLSDLLAGTDYLFILENQGGEAYGAQFVRLGDGVTVDDLVTAAGQDEERALWRLGTPVGGFGRIAPGTEVLMVNSFAEPGTYAVLSPTRVAEGMVATFLVGGRPAPLDPEQRFDLSADDTVGTTEFTFTAPPERPRGVRNNGQQVHEAQLVRLAAGVTVAELVAADDDPVAAGLAEAAGGTAALAPGLVAPWVLSRLEPGRYALVCLLVDAASGKRHLALGMATELGISRP